jgi:hypothetical protein
VDSEEIFVDKDSDTGVSHDAALNIVSAADIKALEGHFAELYTKMNNLMSEVKMLKSAVECLVEENKKWVKLGEICQIQKSSHQQNLQHLKRIL